MNNIQKYLGKGEFNWNYICNCFCYFFICIRIFFTLRNIMNVSGPFYNINSFYRFCSLLIAGEVDISIGSLLAFVAIPLIQIMNFTESVALGIVVCLLVGAAIGIINGFLTVYLGISSLIVPWNAFILRGAVYLYTGQGLFQMNSIQIFSFILGMVNYLELFRMQLL